jgi:hypothetical protein
VTHQKKRPKKAAPNANVSSLTKGYKALRANIDTTFGACRVGGFGVVFEGEVPTCKAAGCQMGSQASSLSMPCAIKRIIERD